MFDVKLAFARVVVVVVLLSACGGSKKGGDTTGGPIVEPPVQGVQGQVCVSDDVCYHRHASAPEQVPPEDAAYAPRCTYQAQNVVVPEGCECPVANNDTRCGPRCIGDDTCPPSFDDAAPCNNNPELKCQFHAEYLGCKHCPPL